MKERDGEDDLMVLDLIDAAVTAGVYWSLAREFPGSAGGFRKLAARHSRRVVALAELVGGSAAWEGDALPPARL